MLVNCPAYYSVSAPKAELLNKIKDMPAEVNEEEEQADVNEKKVQNWDLCSLLRKVVKVLAGLLAPSGRRGGACRVTNLTHIITTAWDVHGTWSNFLTAHLSFSFIKMTKVKVK